VTIFLYSKLYGKFDFFDSTISHIGFILLALSISTQQSIESFIFYIIQYSITNLNTFLILIALSFLIYNSSLQNLFAKVIKNNYYFSIISILMQTIKTKRLIFNILIVENLLKILPEFIFRSKKTVFFFFIKEIKKEFIETDIKFISELKGQFLSNPLISLSFSICLFSMAGIPPLIGFFSKQFVLYSAVLNGYFFISIVAILASVISASYYLKIIKVLHDKNVTNSIKSFWGNEKIKNFSLQNSSGYITKIIKGLLEINSKINRKNADNNKNLFHENYFKEIQLIYILIFIFKFDFIYKSFLNNNSSNSINLNISIKDNYTNKELWQLNTNNYQYLYQIYLNKIKECQKESQFIIKSKELESVSKSVFFYQLTNYHSFLISNLTIIILLFVIKPSILLSSTRLLSLSIFTY
jgi:hypothetical protein